MSGYRAAPTVRTPWGNASELRARKLNPGVGTPREEVARNQRERLFGAMVATVAEKGYKATSVSDLLELAGVSRASFYEHFADKEACFVATIEALLAASVAIGVANYERTGSWEERAERGLRRFIELIAAQPAAARMCAVEAYAAGPAALEPLGRAVDQIEALVAAALEEQPSRRGTPRELTRAAIGGLHWVIYRHLNEGREAELVERVPEIWQWAMSYEPPPRPLLRSRGRRGSPSANGAAPAEGSPPFAAHIPRERILRGFAAAVAERGYAETTIADIAARAHISQATFYANFEGKEDALFAAIDSSGAQMTAATLPAVRRAKSWPEAVHIALTSIFAFLASEPAFARLQAVEAYAAGPEAIAQRDRNVTEVVEVTLALATGEQPPARMPIAQEATVGAIGGMLYDRIRDEGPQVLPDYAPLATYVALAPFLGAERACAVARGENART
jgi:AcrR family transcriptional regulator